MNSDGGSLRDRQQEATRASIIDAFLELAHAANAVTVSMPAVAEKAGVSVRTVYRHFRTKDDLQTAAAYHYDFRARQSLARRAADPRTNARADSFTHYLIELWTEFSEQLPAVLAQHSTPAGRELRTTRLAGAREQARSKLPDGLDTDDELVDMVIAVTSSSMFLELVDRMGHSPEQAASMAVRMVRAIVESAAPRSEAP